MVPLMIETMAKKLEDASLLPAKIVKNQVFGKQFHTICSGGAYLDPSYIDLFKKYDITIQQGYRHDRMFSGYQYFPEVEHPEGFRGDSWCPTVRQRL